MKSNKTKLIELIRKRSGFTVNDCETFIMAKNQEIDYVSIWQTGGGNFLMAIGLFAVLNLLSKIYLNLTKPERFVSLEQHNQVISVKKILTQENPQYRAVIDKWKAPRIGDTVEQDAFMHLCNKLPRQIDLGINSRITPDKIWRAYRNALSHMAWPQGFIQTINISPRRNLTTIQDFYSVISGSYPSAFYNSGDALLCNTDKLALEVHKITDWLCKEIEQDAFDKKQISITLKWLLNNTSI